MKIAFFHGLESKPISDKTEWLMSTFENPYMPAMDYTDPKLFEKVLREVTIQKPDLLVGSSMGGWFAYCISTLTGIPTVLFNPAVQGRSMEPIVRRGSTKANHTVVFGKSDAVVVPSKSLSWFKSNGVGRFDFNFESNAHRTPIGIFRKWVGKSIKSINEEWSIETAEGPDLSFLPESIRFILLSAFEKASFSFDDTEFVKELEEVERVQKSSSSEDIQFARSVDKSPTDVFYSWLVMRGEKPSHSEIDAIWTDRKSIDLITRLKDEFKKPRPYWVSNPNIKAIEGTETDTWSYPSGHSMGAWNIYLKMSDKYPHLRDGLYHLADRIAKSRMVAGVHFRKDIEVAEKIAHILHIGK